MKPLKYNIKLMENYANFLFENNIKTTAIKELKEDKDYTEQFLKDVTRSDIYLGETKLEVSRLEVGGADEIGAKEKLKKYIKKEFPTVSTEGVDKISLAICHLAMQSGAPACIDYAIAAQNVMHLKEMTYMLDPTEITQLKQGRLRNNIKIDKAGKLVVSTLISGVAIVDDKECGNIVSSSVSTIQFDNSGNIKKGPTFISSLTSDNPCMQIYINSKNEAACIQNKELLVNKFVPPKVALNTIQSNLAELYTINDSIKLKIEETEQADSPISKNGEKCSNKDVINKSGLLFSYTKEIKNKIQTNITIQQEMVEIIKNVDKNDEIKPLTGEVTRQLNEINEVVSDKVSDSGNTLNDTKIAPDKVVADLKNIQTKLKNYFNIKNFFTRIGDWLANREVYYKVRQTHKILKTKNTIDNSNASEIITSLKSEPAKMKKW